MIADSDSVPRERYALGAMFPLSRGDYDEAWPLLGWLENFTLAFHERQYTLPVKILNTFTLTSCGTLPKMLKFILINHF